MAVIDYIEGQLGDGEDKQQVGVGGFTMMARVNESSSLTSQAPTAYLEDGSFANDQIVLDPLRLEISGEVSDIYIERDEYAQDLTRLQAEIGNISSKYAGAKTQAAIQRQNAIINDAADAARKVDQVIADGKQAASFLGNQDAQSKSNRESFIDAMEGIHYSRILVSIDMPFRQHTDMRITSFVHSRDNRSNAVKFKITAQKIRQAEVIFTDIDQFFKSPSEAMNKQTESVVDKGVQEPIKSLATTIKEGIKSLFPPSEDG